MLTARSVVWLSELSLDDVDNVGTEFATLGELTRHNIPILNAVIITPQAYLEFENVNNLDYKIGHIVQSVNIARHDSMTQGKRLITSLIRGGEMPRGIYEGIFERLLENSHDKVTIEAYFLQNSELIERKMIVSQNSDIDILDGVKSLWAEQFSWNLFMLDPSKLSGEQKFKAVIAVRPSIPVELSGRVTVGSRKFLGQDRVTVDYPHEAVLSDEESAIVSSYAGRCRRILGGAFEMYFVQSNGAFIVTTIVEKEMRDNHIHHNSHKLNGSIVNHGIATGRIRHVRAQVGKQRFSHDEIVVLDSIQRSMLKKLSAVKGVIVRKPIDRELFVVLSKFGVPVVVGATLSGDAYENGEHVSLDTSRGVIRRGSALH